MSLFNLNLQAFGLDLSDLSFKLAAVSSNVRGQPELTAWNKVSIASGVIEQGLIKQSDKVVTYLQKLRAEVKGTDPGSFAVVSLPESLTFLKLLKISKEDRGEAAAEEDLAELVAEELPKEIPVPLENLTYDYALTKDSESSLEVLVGAVQRDVVLEYTEVLKKAGIKPLAFELEAQSIIRALIPSERQTKTIRRASGRPRKQIHLPKKLFGKRHSKPVKEALVSAAVQGQPKLIVDMGALRTGLVVYDQNTLQLTRSLEHSGRQVTLAIAEKLKLSEAKAEQAKIVCGLDPKKCKGQMAPLLKGWVETLTAEIQETVGYYLNEQPQAKGFVEIILTGGGAALAGLDAKLQKKLNVPVSVGNPLSGFVEPQADELHILAKVLPSLTAVLGLALREE